MSLTLSSWMAQNKLDDTREDAPSPQRGSASLGLARCNSDQHASPTDSCPAYHEDVRMEGTRGMGISLGACPLLVFVLRPALRAQPSMLCLHRCDLHSLNFISSRAWRRITCQNVNRVFLIAECHLYSLSRCRPSLVDSPRAGLAPYMTLGLPHTMELRSPSLSW